MMALATIFTAVRRLAASSVEQVADHRVSQ